MSTSRDAVIVSTARTPLAKSWKGAFNMTHGATLSGHVVKAAIERAGIEPGDVEDVVMGCAMPEGTTGTNVARVAGTLAERAVSELALELFGPESLVYGSFADAHFRLAMTAGVAVGTTEVNLNLVAGRVLGLPRE